MSDEDNKGIKRHMDDIHNDDHQRKIKKVRGEGPHTELRVLLASKNAGAVIGKGGSNIKRLRSDFKAGVTVPDSNGPERILTIGSNLGTCCEILMDVIPNLEDYQQHKDMDFECDTRVLVHQSQAGCIIGRAGFKIKELREETGANIKVYSQCCPQSTERIVQLTGKPLTVVNCIATIFELLQTAPPKGYSSPYDPHNFDEYYAAEYGGFTSMDGGRGGGGGGGGGGDRGGRGGDRGDRRGGSRSGRGEYGMGGRGGSRNSNMGGSGPPPLGSSGMRGGGGSLRGRGSSGRGFSGGGGYSNNGFGRGSGMGGGNMSSMNQNFAQDTMGGMGDQGLMFGTSQGNSNTTQVSIPKDLAGAIIGKGGSRIRQIRIDSGAGITIDEPAPGSNDRIITITGNTDQIQNAQYLLQMSVKQYSGKY